MRGFTITLGDEDSMTYAGTYVYFLIAVSLATLQLKTINQGLGLFNEINVIPVYETSLIIFNLFCGAFVMNG